MVRSTVLLTWIALRHGPVGANTKPCTESIPPMRLGFRGMVNERALPNRGRH
jgi:hypothetical protein